MIFVDVSAESVLVKTKVDCLLDVLNNFPRVAPLRNFVGHSKVRHMGIRELNEPVAGVTHVFVVPLVVFMRSVRSIVSGFHISLSRRNDAVHHGDRRIRVNILRININDENDPHFHHVAWRIGAGHVS